MTYVGNIILHVEFANYVLNGSWSWISSFYNHLKTLFSGTYDILSDRLGIIVHTYVGENPTLTQIVG